MPLLTLLLCACGGAGGTTSPGLPSGPPAISLAESVVTVPIGGGEIALPNPSTSPATTGGDTLTANFPAISVSTQINVTDFGGSALKPPATNIWGSTCPWALEQIQFVFPISSSLAETPSFVITSLRIPGSPAFYYSELFDADTTPSIIIAAQKVDVASDWPSQTVIIPRMSANWTITAGHRYVFEIVASTDPNPSCSGAFN